MFSGVIDVTLLTLHPKNNDIDCNCFVLMCPFILFEVLFVSVSLKV